MLTQTFLLTAPTHYSKSTLRQRGWTDKAIELFLGAPDKEAANPYYKSAPPMKLYLTERVEEIEKRLDYQKFQNKNKKRVDSAKRAVETKREQLLAEVGRWAIHLKKEDYQDVIKNAIRSYNRFKQDIAWERGDFDCDFEPATIDSDKSFLERIAVNYLRHRLSNYDEDLERIFGRVGTSEAYSTLNQRIYTAIAETYPQLQAECDRQLLRKTTGSWK